MPFQPQMLLNAQAGGSTEIQTRYIEVEKNDETLKNELMSKEEKLKVEQQ